MKKTTARRLMERRAERRVDELIRWRNLTPRQRRAELAAKLRAQTQPDEHVQLTVEEVQERILRGFMWTDKCDLMDARELKHYRRLNGVPKSRTWLIPEGAEPHVKVEPKPPRDISAALAHFNAVEAKREKARQDARVAGGQPAILAEVPVVVKPKRTRVWHPPKLPGRRGRVEWV